MNEPLGVDIAALVGYIAPLLSPAEAASLDEGRRTGIYQRAAAGRRLLPVDRLTTVVATIECIGDVEAIPLIEALLTPDDRRAGMEAVRETAAAVHAVLCERARFKRESHTLLRAAHRPPEAEKLLRPAPGAPDADTSRLLRPSSRYDDAPIPERPTEEP